MTRTGGWPDRSSMVVAEEPEGDNINVTATSSSGSNRSWREYSTVPSPYSNFSLNMQQ